MKKYYPVLGSLLSVEDMCEIDRMLGDEIISSQGAKIIFEELWNNGNKILRKYKKEALCADGC